MNYFSLASIYSKLERNEAFLAEIILYLMGNKGNYLTFLNFSQFRRHSILQHKEICETYTFHPFFVPNILIIFTKSIIVEYHIP